MGQLKYRDLMPLETGHYLWREGSVKLIRDKKLVTEHHFATLQ